MEAFDFAKKPARILFGARGGAALFARENTLAAFRMTPKVADFAVCDLALTRDGHWLALKETFWQQACQRLLSAGAAPRIQEHAKADVMATAHCLPEPPRPVWNEDEDEDGADERFEEACELWLEGRRAWHKNDPAIPELADVLTLCAGQKLPLCLLLPEDVTLDVTLAQGPVQGSALDCLARLCAALATAAAAGLPLLVASPDRALLARIHADARLHNVATGLVEGKTDCNALPTGQGDPGDQGDLADGFVPDCLILPKDLATG